MFHAALERPEAIHLDEKRAPLKLSIPSFFSCFADNQETRQLAAAAVRTLGPTLAIMGHLTQ
jgi:hypothetical protein